MRRAMDPAVRLSVPILGVSVCGWWIQITRRLIWVTSETGRLIELLLDKTMTGDEVAPLAASDDTTTRRLGVHRAHQDRGSSAPHRPAVAQDRESYPRPRHTGHHRRPRLHSLRDRVPSGLEGLLARPHRARRARASQRCRDGLPKQVERIQRITHAPNSLSAAATLLEQLIRPGFDPAQGAEATRRYARRKASITVMQYRKGEAPDRYPWTQVGISERRYYKLLPQFAQKVNGRYILDQDDVVAHEGSPGPRRPGAGHSGSRP